MTGHSRHCRHLLKCGSDSKIFVPGETWMMRQAGRQILTNVVILSRINVVKHTYPSSSRLDSNHGMIK